MTVLVNLRKYVPIIETIIEKFDAPNKLNLTLP